MERPTLLCVHEYPSNTGYAWDFIERLQAKVADRLAEAGVRTLVAYPRLREGPSLLAGSAAHAIEFDGTLGHGDPAAMAELVRRENVRVIYYTDTGTWSPRFARLRRAGVRRVVVHDHTSGTREPPRGPKRIAKWLLARAPLVHADRVIVVSDYVARRHLEVGLLPRRLIHRIYNGVAVRPPDPQAGDWLRGELQLEAGRPIVASACRATPQKGVEHLLRAFALVRAAQPEHSGPVLVHAGDGPQLESLRELAGLLGIEAHVHFLGYRPDALRIFAAADICVSPSVWQDALPLAVLEPMALGRPVVASAVGGIPEMIVDGVTGLLVPAADPARLAAAIARLLADPGLAGRLGRNARERVRTSFSPETQVSAVAAVLMEGMAAAHRAVRPKIQPSAPG